MFRQTEVVKRGETGVPNQLKAETKEEGDFNIHGGIFWPFKCVFASLF